MQRLGVPATPRRNYSRFLDGQSPVTTVAYWLFAGATERRMPPAPKFNPGWTHNEMPIVNVTWDEAQAYCERAEARLLTEAEWEYAARAGATGQRYGPIGEIAWYSDNSDHQTHDVAQKQPNAFGLYDMLGNVWEWVNDWYDEKYYRSSPSRDPQGPANGQYRILRGGSWGNFSTDISLSARYPGAPNERHD